VPAIAAATIQISAAVKNILFIFPSTIESAPAPSLSFPAAAAGVACSPAGRTRSPPDHRVGSKRAHWIY
jgi:hypothetical protein